MPNPDLNTFLSTAVDSYVMSFIDRVAKKYKLSSKQLVDMWDQTTTSVAPSKRVKADDSESSSVSEIKVRAKDDDSELNLDESESLPTRQPRGRGGRKPSKVELSEESESIELPTRRNRKAPVVESDDDESEEPVRRGRKAPARGRKAPVDPVESECDDDEPPKRAPARGRKAPIVESDDESDDEPPKRAPARGRKAPVIESEDESDDAPPKRAPARRGRKAPVESDDESDDEPPKRAPARRGRKAPVESDDESDDEPPKRAAKKAPVKKAAGKKSAAREYEETEEMKGGPDYPTPPDGVMFLNGTNFVVDDGKVVASWTKNGFAVLGALAKRSLDSKINENIEYEVYDAEQLDDLFDMASVNAKIKKSKGAPAKGKGRGKK